jgi:lipid-A-disaccharide synthase
MKYYIIAGEASGDLHGCNLIKNLKEIDREADFRCFGGDLMKAAGGNIVFHYKKMSFIGVWEVLKNLKTINQTLRHCKNDILNYKPDAVVLIDYPGFNLKIAEFTKANGIKTLYYIAPKVWASRKSRIKRIRKSVDKLYVILPFEEQYFTKHGCPAEYLGNPLTDAISDFVSADTDLFFRENNLNNKPIIALLAGSRKLEIRYCLPEIIEAVEQLDNYQLVIAGAPSVSLSYYNQFVQDKNIRILFNQTYDILSHAYAAVVVSGTATLETALFKVPEVVFYKVSTPTYIIGRPFVHIKFFSLVNIIMDKQVVKELLQFKLAKRIRQELDQLLSNNGYRQKILDNYGQLEQKIGKPGTSARVAKSMLNYLNE